MRRENMVEKYINEEQVVEAVTYFKRLNISTDRLSLFLVLKRMGISTTRPYNFNDNSSKESFQHAMWIYGGVFDDKEVAGKQSVFFPDNFTSDKPKPSLFYNGSTEFKGLRSRVKDTIRNNNNPQLFSSYGENTFSYVLIRDYINVLTDNVLDNKKISFFYFTIWMFRFLSFNLNDNSDYIFTRVLKKSARDYMRISDNDFHAIFVDDFPGKLISSSDYRFTGNSLRSALDLDQTDNIHPEINAKSDATDFPELTNPISEKKITRFSKATGDNFTPEQITQVLELKKQLILVGVPGVGKSYYINKQLEKFDDYTIVQFHPSSTYEEFIGGETFTNNNIVTRPGKFLTAIQKAKNNPNQKHLFVIDEINRGNIAEIFGETIQILDRQNYKVELPREIDGIKEINLPDNIYILGAMNSSDRSIALLDLAIRRRFAFIELKPNYELISEIIKYNDFDMGAVLETINNRIIELTGDNQKILGQSYVIPNPTSNNVWSNIEFQLQFNSVILPTLEEYAMNDSSLLSGIVGSELSSTILDDEEFYKAFNREFMFARIQNEK